ncbi:MAG TPA: hypothetical protein VF151_10820 [Gemmatimonadales bacterium]
MGPSSIDPVGSFVFGSDNPIAKTLRKFDPLSGLASKVGKAAGVVPDNAPAPQLPPAQPAAPAPADIQASPHRKGPQPIGDTGVMALIRRRQAAQAGNTSAKLRAGVLGTPPAPAKNILDLG